MPPRGHERHGDADLLSAHLAGDPEAFGELFRRHRDRMWAVAIRLLRDPEPAADAVQEAFLAALRRAETFRGDATVSTWLHRIVVNQCLDRLRRGRPVVPLEAVAEPVDEAAVDERVAVAVTVRAALDDLPVNQRVAIVLVDLEDLSIQQAADVLGIAPGTVKSRCSRGRARLARALSGVAPEASRGNPGMALDVPLSTAPTGPLPLTSRDRCKP